MPRSARAVALDLVVLADGASYRACGAYDCALAEGLPKPLVEALRQSVLAAADARHAAEDHLRAMDAPTTEEIADAR